MGRRGGPYRHVRGSVRLTEERLLGMIYLNDPFEIDGSPQALPGCRPMAGSHADEGGTGRASRHAIGPRPSNMQQLARRAADRHGRAPYPHVHRLFCAGR